MDKNDLERRLEAAEKQMLGLQDEIANLKAKLNEVQEDEIPEFPTFYGGKSYYVDGEIVDILSNDSYGIEKDYNAFHTKSYAQEFARKCKLIAMMLHCKWYLCSGFKGDYSDSNDKWVVYYGGLENKFKATNLIHCDYGLVPFDTMENAQKCADWINEHWRDFDD